MLRDGRTRLILALLPVLCGGAVAAGPPQTPCDAGFEIQGYGKGTTGGSGGTHHVVTTLSNLDVPGSLRHAVGTGKQRETLG